jgi:ketosteroid isomerase-like protein
VDHVQLVRGTWDRLAAGDVTMLAAVLAPDARWRAVEDGPWNCESARQILDVVATNLGGRLSGQIEEAFAVGDRVIVGFRPERVDGWPLDNGVRYVVVSVADERITELKGCASRSVALQYAAA